jgi:TATA-binding protein-associated factor
LNLTAADTVIFLEMDFNPFADLQAMDRAHRIGQMKSVNVYRIVTTNSIEETILKIQEQKLATCGAIINTDNSTMFSMGTNCLLDVFNLDNEASALSEFDLDAITDQCTKDYCSLSTEQFSRDLLS